MSSKVQKNTSAPKDLRCEYMVDPVGIDIAAPRLSWLLLHDQRSQSQKAYQVIVADNKNDIDLLKGNIWDSKKIVSDNSVNIPYNGFALESNKAYYWRVCWWDKNDNRSPYSNVSVFETGFLKESDWQAHWICGKEKEQKKSVDPEKTENKPVITPADQPLQETISSQNLLRREFRVEKQIKRACVHMCGLGYSELYINGKKVSDRVLDPAWTDYKKEVLYSSYRVDKYLRPGMNAMGVMLGHSRHIRTYKYEHRMQLILQLEIEYTDGNKEKIISDGAWRSADGPITRDSVYHGETYDARKEKTGWDLPGYRDRLWDNAIVAVSPGGKLVSSVTCPPIKIVGTVSAKKITSPKKDVYIYDMGQNFTGWVKLKVKGKKGTKITLRHAEILDSKGMLELKPIRGAKATDEYILKGVGNEIYHPRFTYHGFRYVEVTGFPGKPKLSDIEGMVVHSDVEQTGNFNCSNQLFNKIHKNILWGQLSNLMSVPTDCPQRDERMGWTGDAQLTVEEAILNFDMAGFYTKWIRELALAQHDDGCVPDVVPEYWKGLGQDPAWGTVYITTAWYLYVYYGDKRILENHYNGIKKWVEYLAALSQNYIIKRDVYGDWCPPMQVGPLATPKDLTCTFQFYKDSLWMSKIAKVLNKTDDSIKYGELAEKIKKAFNEKFLTKDCYVDPYSQTSNILPLFLDMAPEEKKQGIFSVLENTIVDTFDNHLNTGIIGTRYAMETLTKYGRPEIAYKIMNHDKYPSFGYMIGEGATTLWERWEYLGSKGMNSHNHIMFGAVDTWFYKTLCGINLDEEGPGFRKIIINPCFFNEIKFANASLNTINGVIISSWKRKKSFILHKVQLPLNTEGKLIVKKDKTKKTIIKEGNKTIWKNNKFFKSVAGIVSTKEGEEGIIISLGSGLYNFEVYGAKDIVVP